MCDYLTWVFNEETASANAIRSCRTAAGAIHHGFGGGSTVSNSPAIHDLIKGMFHKRPPSRSLVQAWDLSRVLRFMLDLTRKTTFLVAGASGRRVSEIHALSTPENHLELRRDATHLLLRAGFLAKNQTLDFTFTPIILPNLRRARKCPNCGPWCPVRSLRY